MLEKQRFFVSTPKKFPISNGLVFALLAFIVILYIPVFNNLLTNWDDDIYILNNPYLKSLSLENLKHIFTAYYVGNYHPLTLVSLAIDFKLGAIQPWPYQLTNLLLHLCNTLLVYVFVKSLLQKLSSPSIHYSIIAFIAAGLFGIHTFQVESVAWISERKNVLYTFFFLASLIMYLKYIDNKSYRAYILSIVLFILSLLSKGMAVPLSICIIVIDYVAGRNLLSRKVILEKIPYITLSLVFGFIAILAQRSSDSLHGDNDFSWIGRIAVACYGFIQYLIKLCFPYHLSAFYPYPVKPGTLLPYNYYVCIGLIFLFGFILWRYFKQNKTIMFGILFFIANISIVIQLLPVGCAIMADRYVYVASIGFFSIVGYFCNVLWQKNAASRNAVLSLLILYCVMLGFKTYHRVGIWKDSFTLWNDAIKKYPENNDRGYLNRGDVFYDMGNYSMSLQNYNHSLQIDPRDSKAYRGRGQTKQSMNDMQGAMSDFNTALSLCQSYDGYLSRASLKFSLKDFEGTLVDLDKASQINPLGYEAYFDKGFINLNIGNMGNAIKEFNKAIEINSNDFETYLKRSIAKYNLTDYPGAIADLDLSIHLKPSADAYYYKGIANIRLGRKSEECSDLKQSASLGSMEAQAEIQKNCK